MTSRLFRTISLVALMAALLLVYRILPVAAWTTLVVLFAGTVVVHRRKARAALAK